MDLFSLHVAANNEREVALIGITMDQHSIPCVHLNACLLVKTSIKLEISILSFKPFISLSNSQH